MGARVDIFWIDNTPKPTCKVGYMHWGAQGLPRYLPHLIANPPEYIDGDDSAPMADCYAEAAILVVEAERLVLWCSDHSETINGYPGVLDAIVNGWEIKEVACYCVVYFELKRRGMWKKDWKADINGACRFATTNI